jgi:hypothetical protein
MFLNYGLPALRSRFGSSRAAQTARMDPGTRVMSVDLPKQGRVELLAVSYPDPAPNQWWRPDGTAISRELWQVENPGEASFSNAMTVSTNRQLIVRLQDLPTGASGPDFELAESMAYVAGGAVLKDNTALPGATAMLVAMPPEFKKVNLRVGLGLQPWRTILRKDARQQSTTAEVRPGDPRWDANFNNVCDTTEGAQVTVVMSAENRQWSRRVIAVDTNGTEHSTFAGSGTPRESSSTWTYTFRKLPLAEVREFRIEVRPVHWVEFRNVELNPAEPLPVARPVVFGPVRDATLSDLIDLDTGTI